MSERILILGGSPLQLPAAEKALELGLRVGVVDIDPNCVARAIANDFYEISTLDEEGVLNAAREFRADGVMTMATDMAMRSVAFVSQEMGLCGPTVLTAETATDKALMNEALRKNGVLVPRSCTINRGVWQNENLGTIIPAVVKPTDNSGSRGVSLAKSLLELPGAIAYARSHSKSDRVIVQEYITGSEVSVEGFCLNDTTIIVAVTDKKTSGAPHFVELSHTQPSKLVESDVKLVEDTVNQAVAALELRHCGFHAEIIVSDGAAYLIEIGARLGGDFITSHLVPISTGIDMTRSMIEIALGTIPNINHSKRDIARITFLDVPGNRKYEEEARQIPGVVELSLSESNPIGEVKDSSGRFGHIIVTGKSFSEIALSTEQALSLITCS